VEQAFASRTHADLATVTADLPVGLATVTADLPVGLATAGQPEPVRAQGAVPALRPGLAPDRQRAALRE
jgi:hypothetical protein